MLLWSNHSASLISFDTDGHSWAISLKGHVGLPLVDASGGVIATDGYFLVGYYADGTSRGDPVHLYPTQGEVFDLSITLQQANIVVLLYKCGFISTYLPGMLCTNRIAAVTI